jgi:hypothetical protein
MLKKIQSAADFDVARGLAGVKAFVCMSGADACLSRLSASKSFPRMERGFAA